MLEPHAACLTRSSINCKMNWLVSSWKQYFKNRSSSTSLTYPSWVVSTVAVGLKRTLDLLFGFWAFIFNYALVFPCKCKLHGMQLFLAFLSKNMVSSLSITRRYFIYLWRWIWSTSRQSVQSHLKMQFLLFELFGLN